MTRARAVCFWAGVVVIGVALSPPLHSRAEELFAFHMVQHLLLLLVAPAFLVAALSHRIARVPIHPVIVWAIGAVVVWGWHLPDPYELAVESTPIHVAEHVSFLGAGLLFWAVVTVRARLREAQPGALLFVFATSLQSAALGAILTFATEPLYEVHKAGAAEWDTTALADQQLAGAIMWIPAGLVYLATMGWLILRLLSDDPKRSARLIGNILLVAAVVALSACSYIGGRTKPYRPPVEPVAGGDTGRTLYLRDCAWCHGNDGAGTGRAPDLVTGTNGPAFTDFMLRTGRMPIDYPDERVEHREPVYSAAEIGELVDYVSRLGSFGPQIPEVDVAGGDLGLGAKLYQENCAACHSTTGVGGALTSTGAEDDSGGLIAPALHASTPIEVAEAMLVGPGTMPVFGDETFTQSETNAIVAYVDYLRDPSDRGGAPIGRIGPVAEGAVGLIVGLGLVLLAARWMGTKADD